jgi:hypothetical protein
MRNQIEVNVGTVVAYTTLRVGNNFKLRDRCLRCGVILF